MTIPLVNAHGATIPALGFGTFRMSDQEISNIIPVALEAGFRHFDTAQIYGNEAALGNALQSAGVTRNDLFLTTKVWIDNYSPKRFIASVDESLEKLKTDKVDLLLLHWPGEQVPIAQQVEWLNTAKQAGKTHHIGVSNQSLAQWNESIRSSAAPIITNQIEVHPYINQQSMITATHANGAAVTAYYGMADGKVLNDTSILPIANAHGKSTAQIVLRWLLQQGLIALSKTAHSQRVFENAAVFDFVLTPAEMARLNALHQPNGRLVSPKGLAPHWD